MVAPFSPTRSLPEARNDLCLLPTFAFEFSVVVQFEFFCLFKPFIDRHLEGRKRAPRFQGPIHARFWREWVDQRASSPERPCVYLPKQKVPRPYSGAEDGAPSWTGT